MLNTLYLESLPESFDQYHIYAAWSLNVLASNYIVKNIVKKWCHRLLMSTNLVDSNKNIFIIAIRFWPIDDYKVTI